jgi:predicted Zn-dependent protease
MLKMAAKAAADAALGADPEEEYYIGRAVAAEIFARYRPYACAELEEYLNKLGQGLALYSPRPAIYMGYHFMALDSDEVNAFATPGGHVLVTRGLLRSVRSEDELAAVLAHEIAHVALKHGLASVQGARVVKIASDYAMNAGAASGGEAEAFTSAFGASIAEFARLLIMSGYSQTYEIQADLEARNILSKAGYDPNAVASMISRLPPRSDENKEGLAVTHPDPSYRIQALAAQPPAQVPVARHPRYWPAPLRADLAGDEDQAPDPAQTSYARAERFEAMRVLF